MKSHRRAVTYFYLYILRCRDNVLYTGITSDLQRRLKYHNSGNVQFTKNRLPVHLVYFEEYDERAPAALRECQIKGWTRIKKENIIKLGTPKLYAENDR